MVGYFSISTIDYRSRQHDLDFVLTPYYGTDDLTFAAAQDTLTLQYVQTIIQFDRGNTNTSGLDALAVRSAESGFPQVAIADPQMPIADNAEPHLTIDAEGIISNADGTLVTLPVLKYYQLMMFLCWDNRYWVSDEYGPYIYLFSADGHIIQTIQPPAAILPFTSSGVLNFTSETDPATGRAGNQGTCLRLYLKFVVFMCTLYTGFEGLTLDATTNTLYALLQSATIQDGGSKKSTSRYTRLLAYDVSNLSVRPSLIGEWVVPLPQNSKGNTLAASEVHFVSPGVFLALARDGNGRGDDDDSSSYKCVISP